MERDADDDDEEDDEEEQDQPADGSGPAVWPGQSAAGGGRQCHVDESAA